MSTAKYFLFGGLALFAGVGLLGYFKQTPPSHQKSSVLKVDAQEKTTVQVVQEISLPSIKSVKKPEPVHAALTKIEPSSTPLPPPLPPTLIPTIEQSELPSSSTLKLPEADRIRQLFATDASKLPIVETVSYTSRVPWIQGRPAWIADYASHYSTSRHFIARSLNKKPDYLTQKVSLGDRFNVFKRDKNIQFYFIADLSRCRMWFYYIDLDQNERVLLKTYPISIGRSDPKSSSGSLTPIGKYAFGDKVAIYKPKNLGYFQDTQVEMIRVFGTRWIPFNREIEGCSEPAKGFGLHGASWIEDPETHQWTEDRSKIGKSDTDGCIRLNSEDMEEVFAIVITKPTIIELVKDFCDAKPPGVEKTL